MLWVLKLTVGVAVVATLFAQLEGAQCVNLGTLDRSRSLLRQPFLTNPFTPVVFSSVASGGDENTPNIKGGSDRRILEGQPHFGGKRRRRHNGWRGAR